MPVRSVGRRIAADTALWYSLPCAFLVAYVGILGQPVSAVMPHVAVMALPFALLLILRLLLSLSLPQGRVQLALSSLVLALFVGTALTYYVLVLISVGYWGGVASWNAIPTFFRQAPDLADAIGIPRVLVIAGAVALMTALVAACRLYLKRADWTMDLGRSGRVKAIGVSAGFCALWVQVANVTAAPWINQSEPVSMTLFPMEGARDIEGHRVSPADAAPRDALDDRARSAYIPSYDSPKPNLILIVVDAMRPDHMSLFGYGRKTTPYLDELSRTQGLRKLIAHAPCSDTVCGLLSLTGSKLPHNFSFHPFGIHQVLRRNGYRVHLIQAGDHSMFHPMKAYYGEVDSWADGNSVLSTSIDDDQAVIDHLATMPDSDGTPTMFHFHLMSAHVTRRDDGKRVFSPASSYLLAPRTDNDGPDVVLPTATNYYDNGLLSADGVIATLLSELRNKGYLSRALVVITADHGEALGEHGLFTHANSVREEVLKVPVVFVAYGYKPQDPIDGAPFPLQIDIAPTILAELKIPRPTTWEGRPLQDRYEHPLSDFEERDYAGLIDNRQPGSHWKYWLDRGRGNEFAFDLSADPHEAHNAIGSLPSDLLSDWRKRVVYTKH
jgi:glucan phosphoethanolaminetransferase (alkaline phosphatase superfamily)